MEKIEITKETVLSPGDRIEIHFKAPGATWLKATEAALIESRLENHKLFRIRSINYNVPGYLIFTIEVLKTNPIIITAGTIVIAILSVVGIFGIALVVDRMYRFVKTAAGGVSTVGLAVMGIIIALVFFKRQGGGRGGRGGNSY